MLKLKVLDNKMKIYKLLTYTVILIFVIACSVQVGFCQSNIDCLSDKLDEGQPEVHTINYIHDSLSDCFSEQYLDMFSELNKTIKDLEESLIDISGFDPFESLWEYIIFRSFSEPHIQEIYSCADDPDLSELKSDFDSVWNVSVDSAAIFGNNNFKKFYDLYNKTSYEIYNSVNLFMEKYPFITFFAISRNSTPLLDIYNKKLDSCSCEDLEEIYLHGYGLLFSSRSSYDKKNNFETIEIMLFSESISLIYPIEVNADHRYGIEIGIKLN